MPIYEFRCRECGNHENSQAKDPHPCRCGGILRRVFSFSSPTTFQPHFNHSVGKYVTNRQQFHDELKRASERQSERTGIPHNYVPLDPRDAPHTEEGLEETRREARDSGKDVPTKTIIT